MMIINGLEFISAQDWGRKAFFNTYCKSYI